VRYYFDWVVTARASTEFSQAVQERVPDQFGSQSKIIAQPDGFGFPNRLQICGYGDGQNTASTLAADDVIATMLIPEVSQNVGAVVSVLQTADLDLLVVKVDR
jgi:hypothetical protein